MAIADFDFVHQIEEETKKYSYCGTKGYTSPEIMGENEYSAQSDIWSLGIVMIELMLGNKYLIDIGYKMSYIEKQKEIHKQVQDKIQAKGIYSTELIDTILKMISFTPAERRTAYEIYKWCENQLDEQDNENDIDDDIYA